MSLMAIKRRSVGLNLALCKLNWRADIALLSFPVVAGVGIAAAAVAVGGCFSGAS